MKGFSVVDQSASIHTFGYHKCIINIFLHTGIKGCIGYRGVAQVLDYCGSQVAVIETLLTGRNEDEVCPNDVLDSLLLQISTNYGTRN